LTPGKAWPQLKGYLHSDPAENPLIPLPQLVRYWGLEDHLIWNPSLKITQSHGIPDTQLAQLYQCFDLYVHCASGGGWELPPMEAAACGVPVVAVDAPAQNEYLREMPGCSLVPGETQWDHTAAGYRVFASCADLVRHMLVYLEVAPEAREEIGRRNREFVLGYKWEDIALRWEALFHQLLEPKNRIEPWRLLQEV
jgi:glycosyltransferase involved in cell wall biosynthesis